MANVLPLSEGEQWDFDYSYRKDVVEVSHHVTTREGTVTLNVLEISPCDQDQRFISLEKRTSFLEVEMWDSLADGVDVRYDSTSLAAIDALMRHAARSRPCRTTTSATAFNCYTGRATPRRRASFAGSQAVSAGIRT